jgi:hypothetical protein
VNKKAGQAAAIENESVDDDTVDDSLRDDEGEVDPSFTARMKEFIAKSKIDTAHVSFYLYKYDNSSSGEAKSLLKKFAEGDNPPDEDEVGRTFGSGRYIIMMTTFQNGKSFVRSYKFKLHQHYDTIRMTPVAQPATAVVPAHDSNKNFMDAMMMIQTMMSTMMQSFIPLFQRPPESPDMAKMIAGNYAMVNDIAKKQMMNNVDLMADYQRKVILLNKQAGIDDTDTEEIEEPQSDVMTIIEQIKPFIGEWLPKLIGGGQQSKVVSTIVKSSSMFQEIARNRKMVNALVRHLDGTSGKENTDIVLKKLGISRVAGK